MTKFTLVNPRPIGNSSGGKSMKTNFNASSALKAAKSAFTTLSKNIQNKSKVKFLFTLASQNGENFHFEGTKTPSGTSSTANLSVKAYSIPSQKQVDKMFKMIGGQGEYKKITSHRGGKKDKKKSSESSDSDSFSPPHWAPSNTYWFYDPFVFSNVFYTDLLFDGSLMFPGLLYPFGLKDIDDLYLMPYPYMSPVLL